MRDCKKITIDYLEGKITPSDYEKMVETDDVLYQWIQGILPDGKKFSYCTPPSLELIYYPYDIRDVMRVHERIEYGGPKGSLGYHHYINQEIAKIVKDAFPELSFQLDPRPEMLRFLGLVACPRYIGGSEVAMSNILADLLADIPMEWSDGKKTKVARERIKAAFHIDGTHYPRWIQEPEWPVSGKTPMKYEKTVRVNPEFVQHYFVDVHTGTVRIVDDFF